MKIYRFDRTTRNKGCLHWLEIMAYVHVMSFYVLYIFDWRIFGFMPFFLLQGHSKLVAILSCTLFLFLRGGNIIQTTLPSWAEPDENFRGQGERGKFCYSGILFVVDKCWHGGGSTSGLARELSPARMHLVVLISRLDRWLWTRVCLIFEPCIQHILPSSGFIRPSGYSAMSWFNRPHAVKLTRKVVHASELTSAGGMKWWEACMHQLVMVENAAIN